MIKVQNLAYSFPQKDLFADVTFTIEEGVHCVLFGTNGTGKSTLLHILREPELYMYTGTIEQENGGSVGYVSQMIPEISENTTTVMTYLSENFVRIQDKLNAYYTLMETAEDLTTVLEEYQLVLDEWTAVDGDSFESNILKQLNLANLSKLKDQAISSLSSGEFKLIQIIKEMLSNPKLLFMDEPDVFLDFEHLNSLRTLLNTHKGTLLVITHNRYLLNHCFNKIIHMENQRVNEFNGNYISYNFELLSRKVELAEIAAKEQAEIDRQQKIVENARERATQMFSASLGKTVHARQKIVDRLTARKTTEPFVDISQPDIKFSVAHEMQDEVILELQNYNLTFDEQLLDAVNITLLSGHHVAIVGRNGTGKTSLLLDIWRNEKESIQILPGIEVGLFTSKNELMSSPEKTVYELFEQDGLYPRELAISYLESYGFESDLLGQTFSELSGGEKDLLQLALLARQKKDFLLLDEPTGHLDIYAQIALEQAVQEYKGTILMVSHDYYTVANCVDYVLLIEQGTIRKISARKFRQMIYANHFDKDYLLLEQEKKTKETQVLQLLQKAEFDKARAVLASLEHIIQNMGM